MHRVLPYSESDYAGIIKRKLLTSIWHFSWQKSYWVVGLWQSSSKESHSFKGLARPERW